MENASTPLSIGSVGAQVLDVQHRLRRLGATSVPSDGHFDDATQQAVRAFQRERGLPADGVVTPETWLVLVEAGYALGDRLLLRTRRPLRGDDVLELQQRLNQLGFDAGGEDGIFSDTTQSAVEDFQRNTGMAVDGRVGPATVAQLSRLHRNHQHARAGARARERERLRNWAGQSATGRRILVDPAHGPDDDVMVGAAGVDIGAVTWPIAARTAARLNSVGASAFLSRGPRTTPSGSDRARLANELGVDVVVSIGMNVSETPEAHGAATYYFGSHRSTSESGRRLAERLQDRLVSAGAVPDCRVHPMTWAILRETRMTAVVVEPGFLTSPLDGPRLRAAAGQEVVAATLVTGLLQFFDAPLVRQPA